MTAGATVHARLAIILPGAGAGHHRGRGHHQQHGEEDEQLHHVVILPKSPPLKTNEDDPLETG